MDETITELEQVAATLWVAPVEERLGSWLLPLPDAVAAVERWYGARGLRPMFAGVPDASFRVDQEPDAAWTTLYHYQGRPLPPIGRALLLSAPWQGFGSIRDDDGTVIAVGRVALAGEWASITAIEVAPAWRRRGLGSAITSALCREAAARGARRVLLQVEMDNAAALALYARVGFTPVHRYQYRVAPA